MPGPDLLLRDVEVGDAEALAHILITANEAAFRGRSPDQCLTLTEVQRAANWRRTLMAGLPPGDFLVVVRATIRSNARQSALTGFAPTGKAGESVAVLSRCSGC
jgi:hypothetical protein